MYKYIQSVWCPLGFAVLGIRVKTKGDRKQLPESAMFLANHGSFGDILALYIGLRRPLHFIARKSLSKIPMLGLMLRKTKSVLVSKGYNKESRKTYSEAITLIKSGLDLVVFPEGTRSKDGNLGKMRKGAFQMAIDAGSPIVPVGIKNAAKLFPRNNFSFRPGVIEVVIGQPIDTGNYSREQLPELMDEYTVQLKKLLC